MNDRHPSSLEDLRDAEPKSSDLSCDDDRLEKFGWGLCRRIMWNNAWWLVIIAVDNDNAEEYDTVQADIPGDAHNDTYEGTQGGDGDDDD